MKRSSPRCPPGAAGDESNKSVDRTRSRLYIAVLLAAVMLGAGCSATVGGRARPDPSQTPRSLNGETLKRVLVGKSALSRIVNEPLELDPLFPPVFGGPEALQGDKSAAPIDCLGVAVMMQPAVYQSGKVRDVALKTWRPDSEAATVTRVKEGVVSLPSAADANALFATFAKQWETCEDKALPIPGKIFRLKVKVSNVQVANSVVAATISMDFNLPISSGPDIPAARAIGVRGNCLLEVEVDYFNSPGPTVPGSRDITGSALEIAQVMRDKVSALS